MPRERKRREHYVPSSAQPAPGWSPPSEPGAMFDCVATRCRLSADACCVRQTRTIQGTPEPRFPFCHHDCAQGRMVREAMPPSYVPRKCWFKKGHAFQKAPLRSPAVEADADAGPYAPFRELVALVAPPVPTRDD